MFLSLYDDDLSGIGIGTEEKYAILHERGRVFIQCPNCHTYSEFQFTHGHVKEMRCSWIRCQRRFKVIVETVGECFDEGVAYSYLVYSYG